MARVRNLLFVTIDGGGNIPQVLGLAKRLSAQGDTVTVLTEPCMEATVRNMGLQCITFKTYFTRTDRNEDLLKDANTNILTNKVLDDIVFGPTAILVEETLRAIEQSSADMVLADCLLPGATIAAEIKRIRRVILFHFPEYFPGPNRPPGVMGLTPGKGLLGKMRDRLLGFVFNLKLNSYLSAINTVRKKYALPPFKNTRDLMDTADARLIQTIPQFDFPLDPAPANVRYTGPILDDPDWTGAWTSPWPANDNRPLVVVSLSTTFQDQGPTIRNCISALSKLPVRALVTLGPALDPADFPAADNVIVIRSAPHSKIFPHAAMVITHGGHGTIMRALYNGLPLLCMPMGRDQNDNAAKVVYHGLGLQLKPTASSAAIATAVRNLLADTAIQKQTAQFASLLADMQSKNANVRCIEDLLNEA